MGPRTDPPSTSGMLPTANPATVAAGPGPVLVNDIHSALNPTWVDRVVRPETIDELQAIVRGARVEGRALSVAGGRHAMGGQQFGTGTILVDMRGLRRVRGFDAMRGTIEVEAGIQWPELIEWLLQEQVGRPDQWTIAQKQTGADRLTIGGAVAANVHGRGLAMRPFVGDVEALTLVNAQGELLRCSRTENAELFRLVIGGYGLFGIVATVSVRLVPRRKLQRVVEILTADELISAFEQRIVDGYLYGDFQFAIDPGSPDFLYRGIFSTYRPVSLDTPIPEGQRVLTEHDWKHLLFLTHARKGEAYALYAQHYLATSGQVYWSDTHQTSTYLDDYHPELDQRLCAPHPCSEVITELYVSRPLLADFLSEAREELRRPEVNVIYGTIRVIERDDETVLAWAKERYACTIFNLHTEHTPHGQAHAAAAFRRLIDMAARRGGSYFLTYHRHATRDQVLACYPRFPEFLARKLEYDPEERFQSDWYGYYRGSVGGGQGSDANEWRGAGLGTGGQELRTP